jgi:tetratricopeptide (TPR) repeat protein
MRYPETGIRCSRPLLLCAALCSCATLGSRVEEEDDGLGQDTQIVVDPVLVDRPDLPILMMGAATFCGIQAMHSNQGPREGEADSRWFVADFMALVAMAIGWPGEKEKKNLESPSLDALVKIRDAEFMAEYMIAYYDNPLWKLPLKNAPRFREFLDWKGENLPDHEPVPLVSVVAQNGRRVNADRRMIPRHPDLDAVLAASQAVGKGASCDPYRETLERVANEWPPASHRQGRPVSVSHPREYLAYLEATASTGEVRPFPYAVSPAYVVAVRTLLTCDNRQGKGCGRWVSLLKDIDPMLKEQLEKASEAAVNVPAGCPTEATEIDMAACAASRPENYGYGKELPMEIGMAAKGQSLWFGRLLCNDGAVPEVRRTGNVGPRVAPTSAVSWLSIDADSELLDRWEVSCPGDREPKVLYTNLYRCGLLCPPRGFRLLTAASEATYNASLELAGKGRFQEAFDLVLELPTEDLASETLTSWRGVLLSRLERYDEARPALQAVVALRPKNPYYRLELAMVDLGQGKNEEYFKVVEALLAELPTDDELHWELICRKGFHLLRSGNAQDGEPLIKQACEAGFERCCKPTQ